jgi:hypothetical protein
MLEEIATNLLHSSFTIKHEHALQIKAIFLNQNTIVPAYRAMDVACKRNINMS